MSCLQMAELLSVRNGMNIQIMALKKDEVLCRFKLAKRQNFVW